MNLIISAPVKIIIHLELIYRTYMVLTMMCIYIYYEPLVNDANCHTLVRDVFRSEMAFHRDGFSCQ